MRRRLLRKRPILKGVSVHKNLGEIRRRHTAQRGSPERSDPVGTALVCWEDTRVESKEMMKMGEEKCIFANVNFGVRRCFVVMMMMKNDALCEW